MVRKLTIPQQTLLNLIQNNKNKNLVILKSRNGAYQDIQKQLYEELKGKRINNKNKSIYK